MKERVLKSISILMSFVFLVDTLIAAPVSTNNHELRLPNYETKTNIFIPEQYGKIEKSMVYGLSAIDSPKQPTVILIKDAHCNYEAQHNIAKILEALVRDYGVDLVAVEGAEGDVDLSEYGRYKDEKAKQSAVDTYVKKGYVTGPEYLNITKYNKLPFGIYGIENGKLYADNFISFRQTWTNSKETEYFINEVNTIAGALKEKIYSSELLDFDKRDTEYRENKISLTEWIKQCSVFSAQCAGNPNFSLVLMSIKLEEKIDFKKVEKEREELIKYLEKALPKEELDELVRKSLQFRLGKIPSLEYYKYLREFIAANHKLQSTINLQRYIRLVKLQSKINTEELFNEIDTIAGEIKDRLFKNGLEKQIDGIAHRADILNKLFHLQLNRKDLQYFENNKNEFNTEPLLSFIKIQAPLNGINVPAELDDNNFLDKVDSSIMPADRFYGIAVERDKVLVENTIFKMQKDKKNTAVMVVGGFHADGIKKILEQKGINCIEITPKITKEQIDNPYLSIMLDSRIKVIGSNNTERNMLAIPNAFQEKIGQLDLTGVSAEVGEGLERLIRAKGKGEGIDGDGLNVVRRAIRELSAQGKFESAAILSEIFGLDKLDQDAKAEMPEVDIPLGDSLFRVEGTKPDRPGAGPVVEPSRPVTGVRGSPAKGPVGGKKEEKIVGKKRPAPTEQELVVQVDRTYRRQEIDNLLIKSRISFDFRQVKAGEISIDSRKTFDKVHEEYLAEHELTSLSLTIPDPRIWHILSMKELEFTRDFAKMHLNELGEILEGLIGNGLIRGTHIPYWETDDGIMHLLNTYAAGNGEGLVRVFCGYISEDYNIDKYLNNNKDKINRKVRDIFPEEGKEYATRDVDDNIDALTDLYRRRALLREIMFRWTRNENLIRVLGNRQKAQSFVRAHSINPIHDRFDFDFSEAKAGKISSIAGKSFDKAYAKMSSRLAQGEDMQDPRLWLMVSHKERTFAEELMQMDIDALAGRLKELMETGIISKTPEIEHYNKQSGRDKEMERLIKEKGDNPRDLLIAFIRYLAKDKNMYLYITPIVAEIKKYCAKEKLEDPEKEYLSALYQCRALYREIMFRQTDKNKLRSVIDKRKRVWAYVEASRVPLWSYVRIEEAAVAAPRGIPKFLIEMKSIMLEIGSIVLTGIKTGLKYTGLILLGGTATILCAACVSLLAYWGVFFITDSFLFIKYFNLLFYTTLGLLPIGTVTMLRFSKHARDWAGYFSSALFLTIPGLAVVFTGIFTGMYYLYFLSHISFSIVSILAVLIISVPAYKYKPLSVLKIIHKLRWPGLIAVPIAVLGFYLIEFNYPDVIKDYNGLGNIAEISVTEKVKGEAKAEPTVGEVVQRLGSLTDGVKDDKEVREEVYRINMILRENRCRIGVVGETKKEQQGETKKIQQGIKKNIENIKNIKNPVTRWMVFDLYKQLLGKMKPYIKAWALEQEQELLKQMEFDLKQEMERVKRGGAVSVGIQDIEAVRIIREFPGDLIPELKTIAEQYNISPYDLIFAVETRLYEGVSVEEIRGELAKYHVVPDAVTKELSRRLRDWIKSYRFGPEIRDLLMGFGAGSDETMSAMQINPGLVKWFARDLWKDNGLNVYGLSNSEIAWHLMIDRSLSIKTTAVILNGMKQDGQGVFSSVPYYILFDLYPDGPYRSDELWLRGNIADYYRLLHLYRLIVISGVLEGKSVSVDLSTEGEKATAKKMKKKAKAQGDDFSEGLLERSLEKTSSGSGLIGKWEILSKPAFVKGMLKFRGRHIETGEEKDIEIGAELKAKADVFSLLDKLPFADGCNTKLTNGIIAWFKDEFNGMVLLLDDNSEEINGIGTSGIIAVSRKLFDEPIALFHEIAEAMTSSERLKFNDIVGNIGKKNKYWYFKKVKKENRRNMQMHYAIRALQREVFGPMDRNLTYGIKGRITIAEAQNLIVGMLRSENRQGKLKNIRTEAGQVLKIFLERREKMQLSFREQDVSLLEETVAFYLDSVKPVQAVVAAGNRAGAGGYESVAALVEVVDEPSSFVLDEKLREDPRALDQVAEEIYKRTTDGTREAEENNTEARMRLNDAVWHELVSNKLVQKYPKQRHVKAIVDELFKSTLDSGAETYLSRISVRRSITDALSKYKTWTFGQLMSDVKGALLDQDRDIIVGFRGEPRILARYFNGKILVNLDYLDTIRGNQQLTAELFFRMALEAVTSKINIPHKNMVLRFLSVSAFIGKNYVAGQDLWDLDVWDTKKRRKSDSDGWKSAIRIFKRISRHPELLAKFPKTYFGRAGRTMRRAVSYAMKHLGVKEARVLTVGTSIGCEAYDLAMDMYEDTTAQGLEHRIIVTDLDPELVRVTEDGGFYNNVTVLGLLEDRRDLTSREARKRARTYFEKQGGGYRFHRDILEENGFNFSFSAMDVTDKRAIQKAVEGKKCNFILFRNVHFPKDKIFEVYSNLAEVLEDDGFILMSYGPLLAGKSLYLPFTGDLELDSASLMLFRKSDLLRAKSLWEEYADENAVNNYEQYGHIKQLVAGEKIAKRLLYLIKEGKIEKVDKYLDVLGTTGLETSILRNLVLYYLYKSDKKVAEEVILKSKTLIPNFKDYPFIMPRGCKQKEKDDFLSFLQGLTRKFTGRSGALKDIGLPEEDNEIELSADQILKLVPVFKAMQGSDVQRKICNINGVDIKWCVVKYDETDDNDPIWKIVKDNNLRNAFHLYSDSGDQDGVIFVSKNALDPTSYEQHELYEISMRKKLGRQITEDIKAGKYPPEFTFERIIHILAWAMQIGINTDKGKWDIAEDSEFVKQKIGNMEVDQLVKIISEDRSFYWELIDSYFKTICDEQGMMFVNEQIRQFDLGVKYYAWKTLSPHFIKMKQSGELDAKVDSISDKALRLIAVFISQQIIDLNEGNIGKAESQKIEGLREINNKILERFHISLDSRPEGAKEYLSRSDALGKLVNEIISEPVKKINVIMGVPGSGKTTFADDLAVGLRKRLTESASSMNVVVLHQDEGETADYDANTIYIVEGFSKEESDVDFFINNVPPEIDVRTVWMHVTPDEAKKRLQARGRDDDTQLLRNYREYYIVEYMEVDFSQCDMVVVNDDKGAGGVWDAVFKISEDIGFFADATEKKALRNIVEKLGLKPGQKYLHVGVSYYKVIPLLTLYGVQCVYVDYDPYTTSAVKRNIDLIFPNLPSIHPIYLYINIDDSSICSLINDQGISVNDVDGFDVVTMFHIFKGFYGIYKNAIKNLLSLVKNNGTLWFTPVTNGSDNIVELMLDVARDKFPKLEIKLRQIEEEGIIDPGYPDDSANHGFRVSKAKINLPEEVGSGRKSLVHTDVKIGSRDKAMLRRRAEEYPVADNERETKNNKVRYKLIQYNSGDEVDNIFKKYGINGAYNLTSRYGKTRYIFMQRLLPDYEIAFEHEELEVEWLEKLKGETLPEGVTIQRAAHILAWAMQIAQRNWQSGSQSEFIKMQMNGMAADKLVKIISENRSIHNELILKYLHNVVDKGKLANVKMFEYSIKYYAYRMLCVKIRNIKTAGTYEQWLDSLSKEQMQAIVCLIMNDIIDINESKGDEKESRIEFLRDIKDSLLKRLGININLPPEQAPLRLDAEEALTRLTDIILGEPSKINIIMGVPGAGKSTFAAKLEKRIQEKNSGRKVRVVKRDSMQAVKYKEDTIYIFEGIGTRDAVNDFIKDIPGKTGRRLIWVYTQPAICVKRLGARKGRPKDILHIKNCAEYYALAYLQEDFSKYDMVVINDEEGEVPAEVTGGAMKKITASSVRLKGTYWNEEIKPQIDGGYIVPRGGVEEIQMEGVGIKYQVYFYKKGSKLEEFFREKGVSGGCGYTIGRAAQDTITHIFVEDELNDEQREDVIRHEILQVSYRCAIRGRSKEDRMDIRKMLDPLLEQGEADNIERMAHICAWAKQINDKQRGGKWQTAEDCWFIKKEIGEMNKEQLLEVVRKDRSVYYELLITLGLSIDEVAAVKIFDESVKDFAFKELKNRGFNGIIIGENSRKALHKAINQDASFAETLPNGITITGIFDGVGGAPAGEIASYAARCVVLSMLRRYSKRDFNKGNIEKLMKDSLKTANKMIQRIWDYDAGIERKAIEMSFGNIHGASLLGKEEKEKIVDMIFNSLQKGKIHGMCTTALISVIMPQENGISRAYIMNCGDSRVYHFSSAAQSVKQVTKDDVFGVEELVNKWHEIKDKTGHRYLSDKERDLIIKDPTQAEVIFAQKPPEFLLEIGRELKCLFFHRTRRDYKDLYGCYEFLARTIEARGHGLPYNDGRVRSVGQLLGKKLKIYGEGLKMVLGSIFFIANECVEVELSADDRLVSVTDGLYKYCAKNEFEDIIKSSTLGIMAEELILKSRGLDDGTVVELINMDPMPAVALSLSIPEKEFRALLAKLGDTEEDEELRNKLMRLIMADGKISKEEIDILIKNIEKVLAVLSNIRWVMNSKRGKTEEQEAVTRLSQYLSILDLEKIQISGTLPICMQKLASQLENMGFIDEGQALGLMEEIRKKDCAIADVYFRKILEVCNTSGKADEDIKGLIKLVETTRKYLHARAEFAKVLKVEPEEMAEGVIGNNIAKIVNDYLTKRDGKAQAADILARFLVDSEEFSDIDQKTKASIHHIIIAKRLDINKIKIEDLEKNGLERFGENIEEKMDNELKSEKLVSNLADGVVILQDISLYLNGNERWLRENLNGITVSAIQGSLASGNLCFAYESDELKEQFIRLLGSKGINVDESRFIRISGEKSYQDIKVQTKSKQLITVLKNMDDRFKDIDPQDMVFTNSDNVVDLYLMWKVVLISMRSGAEEEIKLNLQAFLKEYYKGTDKEKFITSSVEDMFIDEGHIEIPPAAKFVSDYYEAEARAEGLIRSSA